MCLQDTSEAQSAGNGFWAILYYSYKGLEEDVIASVGYSWRNCLEHEPGRTAATTATTDCANLETVQSCWTGKSKKTMTKMRVPRVPFTMAVGQVL